MRQIRPLAVALALGCALSGCASGNDDSADINAVEAAETADQEGMENATGDFSATQGSSEVQDDAPRPYASPLIQFTTSEGWTYEWQQPSLPLVTLTAEKDVQSSPPGKARLLTHATFASVVLPQDFTVPKPVETPATKGRTAPQIRGVEVEIVFDMPEGFYDFANATKNRISLFCPPGQFSGRWYGSADLQKTTSGASVPGASVVCNTLAIGGQLYIANGTPTSTSDLDEAFVDQYLTYMKAETPGIIVIYVGACSVALLPDGQVGLSYRVDGATKCEIIS